MKKYIIILSIVIGVIALIVIASPNQESKLLKTYGINNLSTQKMVESLEKQTINPEALIASISATTLTLTTPNQVYTYQVPNTLFYLSVAPYINNTHPCGTHNLTTCRGELANETFEVRVVTQSGLIILHENITTNDNGFMGIWLPRNIEGTIEVNYQGMLSSYEISTSIDSDTCLTTMRLT
ncbi:CueP family metal-binding protein [Peloplasma aerotolerans]|uniref:CueP family metal-binding protein n=1 Tax=Peloplasma aerotolerans TaxID=3044389 RepID=A0AAW6U4G4_9MOLU|nr:CueP family metal-binding protein [Mariniplasma sp. M4Ah]MDI6452782.1 CueP family metal-binding protein [Mariniplasma sp. M4Ah]